MKRSLAAGPAVLLCLTSVASQATLASFTDVTASAGIFHTQRILPFAANRYAPQSNMAGAAAAGDYDNDGWVDLYFTRLDGSDLLYRNLGNGTFADVTEAAFGPGHLANVGTNGCAWADIDNDGDQDLYVTSLDSYRYHLFINDGSGSFTEEALTRGAGLEGSDRHFGFSVSFGDYDNDGYLDLHVNEWRTSHQNPGRAPSNTRLLRNRGAVAPGHFEDVTVAAGVVMTRVRPGALPGEALAFCSRFVDLDQDGWLDLLVVSDGGTSSLFWNRRDGTFSDGTSSSNTGTDQFGMGMAVGDYDGDGQFDWFVTSIHDGAAANGNRLYRYTGGRRFTDVTDEARVRFGGWGWGATFLDFDNDRDLDLMMVNGMPNLAPDPTTLWSNDGHGAFLNETGPSSGITDQQVGMGVLCLDYDHDGDLDTLVINNAGAPILYQNQGISGHAWLRIKTTGTRSNRDGIGTIVRVRVAHDDPPQVRYVDGGSNFLSQNERTLHFGLGAVPADRIAEIEIRWPGGLVQVLKDLAPNQVLDLVEPGVVALPLKEVKVLPSGEGVKTVWRSPMETICVLEYSDDLVIWRKAALLETRAGDTVWIDRPRDGQDPPRQRYYRGW